MTARKRPTSSKIAPGLVALSTSAILSVYAAGYVRTRSAAEAFETTSGRHRDVGPSSPSPDAPQGASTSPTLAAPAASTAAVTAPPTQPRAVAAPPTPVREEARAAAASPTPKVASAGVPALTTPTASVAPPAPSIEPRDARIAEPAPTAPTPAPASVPAPAVAEVAPAPVPSPVEAAPAVAAAPTAYTDGIYTGWGRSRHGDIEAKVVVEAGRITSAEIKSCWTRYPCTVIEKLPPQVTARQSYNVDYVSGATESADAFYDAVKEALSKAK